MGNTSSAQARQEISDARQLPAVKTSNPSACVDNKPNNETNMISAEETMKTIVSGSSEEAHHDDAGSVVSVDSSVNDFDSSDEEDDEEIEEFLAERKAILNEARNLKAFAEFYHAPEKKVITTDPFASARCFFDRPSAPQADESFEEERDMIMADLKQLKVTAEWYLQPEKEVEVDATACGRCYFDRASGPEFEVDEDAMDEEEAIMQDIQELKKLADWYLHPEKPVEVDGTACARNFFNRASAPTNQEEKERQQILSEMAELKKVAEWYHCPEKPVVCDDACATGRNYFSRPSAPDTAEDDMERQQVLAEAMELKMVAGWYMHPEAPLEVDSTACARSYFSRASAEEQEEEEDMDELEQILAEMAGLKKVAEWYHCPEKPVVCEDSCLYGRNYFSRASAPTSEGELERQHVLAEAAELKKVAEWYHCPEKPVVCEDATLYGRNYFSRASAPTSEGERERQRVLAEMAELKKVAGWYMHPEAPVVSEDSTACGRNYFSRASAPDTAEEDLERQQVLADAMALKQVAEWYHCPEKPVEVDSTACARNFFSRPSAPTNEEEEERQQAHAEAAELKKVAGWYMHPETPVTSCVAVTRNYFTRPSAEEHIETMEDEEERARILGEAASFKKLAVDYLHPEKGVNSSINCVRNYFDRASAPGHKDQIHTEGHAVGQQGYLEVHHFDDHDMHHYDYDYGHHHHDDHSMQSDHFEMEEDQLHAFHDSMLAYQQGHDQQVPIITEGNEKEGGTLSRSPSDVMLFDEAAM